MGHRGRGGGTGGPILNHPAANMGAFGPRGTSFFRLLPPFVFPFRQRPMFAPWQATFLPRDLA